MTLSPLTSRRLAQFKANKRGFYSFWVFLALLALCLSAEFIANDKPLLIKYDSGLYMPVFKNYPETTFGGEFETETDYRDPYVKDLIAAKGWMIWPPVRFSYDTINYELAVPAPSAPTSANIFGTDDQGRDVAARVIYGFRISVLFGLALTIISSIIGITAGAFQGYYGGRLDLIMQRMIEVWSSLPSLYILIIFSAMFVPGFWTLLAILLLFSWVSLVDVVRAEFLRTRNFDYVRAAGALGVSNLTIMRRHVLPNAMVATLTLMPFILTGSITALTSLDFLGLGLPPGSASLGELLAQGKNNLQAPWLGITAFVSLALMLSLLTFIGEAVRDAFDPQKDDPMTLSNSIPAIAAEVTACRRSLHENPQTAFEETFAHDLVVQKLKEWGVAFEDGWAKTGIIATIEGKTNKSGKKIGLRADMDALDILEKSGQPWASKTPGKMHGCGHDGHTAMLLGAAKYLADTRNFDGTVYLIFQPAEEGKGGALRMIEQGLFDTYKMDSVYGLHNWPEMPKGTIGMRPGPIMAAADRFNITINGRGSHAAMPHHSIDPIVIGAQIVTALQTLVSRSVDPVDTAVLTITNFNAGTGAFNVIDDKAKLSGTFRSFRPETRALLQKRITEITQSMAATFGATADVSFGEGYDPTLNDPAATEFCAAVARDLMGEANVSTTVEPCMGAEDFGAMLQKVPGCYVWMGQKEVNDPNSPHNKGLHNPEYDFNDSIIPSGIEYWAKLVEAALPLK